MHRREVLAKVPVAEDGWWAGKVVRASADLDLARRAFALRRLSRQSFDGFISPNPTRWWEYPWVAREVERRASSGYLADFGAGTSPMVIHFAQRGFRAAAVDPDAQKLYGDKYANEWDFVDYAKWGVETVKAGIEERVFDEGVLDVAISVSTIEHVTAEDRRTGIREVARAVRDGGLVVLTLDVFPGQRVLWNRAIDEVEPTAEHGTVDDVIDECRDSGLRVVAADRCPIESRPTGVEAIALVKTG